MTREDVLKIFPEASKEDVTRLLNAHHVELQEAKGIISEYETKFKDVTSKISEYESKLKENQSAEDRIQQALKQASDAEKRYSTSLNRLEAEKQLLAAGIKEETYKDLLDNIVTDNKEQTMNTVSMFTNIMKTSLEEREKALKEQLLKETPKPAKAGAQEREVTKEEFDKMGYRQRLKIYNENPDLYQQLKGEEIDE